MIYFDSKIWKQGFVSNKHDTAWKCCKCGIGSLKLTEKLETKSSTFGVKLVCTDFHCRKKYFAVGEIVFTAKETKVSKEFRYIDDFRLYPTHFQPELIMFEMPITMLEEIKLKLVKSFNHFWYDLDACANKIRQAIELMVDCKEGTGPNLDQKIKSIESDLGVELTNNLLALKWIGNDGSHAGRPFERDEILDAYSLLVDALNQLYPDESEKTRRESLVNVILQKKGLKNL
jgi:hypothetical protein